MSCVLDMLNTVSYKLESSNAVSYELELSSVLLNAVVLEQSSTGSCPGSVDDTDIGSHWLSLLNEGGELAVDGVGVITPWLCEIEQSSEGIGVG